MTKATEIGIRNIILGKCLRLLREMGQRTKMGHKWCACCREYDGEHADGCELTNIVKAIEEVLKV